MLTASAPLSERSHVPEPSSHVHAGRPLPIRSEIVAASSPAAAALAPATSAAYSNCAGGGDVREPRSEEHTSELQSRENLVCRLLLEKKTNKIPVLLS